MKSLDAELKETQKAHDKTKEEVKNLKALLQSATYTLKSTLVRCCMHTTLFLIYNDNVDQVRGR